MRRWLEETTLIAVLDGLAFGGQGQRPSKIATELQRPSALDGAYAHVCHDDAYRPEGRGVPRKTEDRPGNPWTWLHQRSTGGHTFSISHDANAGIENRVMALTGIDRHKKQSKCFL
jgi:hypothetical protein